MYWLYLTLFLVVISTPLLIQGERGYLTEDMREALVIFAAGAVTLILYIAKEKSLLRHVREKLWFQQKTTAITKDLSQSYSYIGEVNRKVDILKGMMHRLVEMENGKQSAERMFWEVLDTLKHIAQADRVSLRIFKNQRCVHRLEEKADRRVFSVLTDEELLQNEKGFFAIDGIQGIASQETRKQIKIVLLFSRSQNDEVDEDVLHILLSLLLLLEGCLSKE